MTFFKKKEKNYSPHSQLHTILFQLLITLQTPGAAKRYLYMNSFPVTKVLLFIALKIKLHALSKLKLLFLFSF
jgi:hypothetical protein